MSFGPPHTKHARDPAAYRVLAKRLVYFTEVSSRHPPLTTCVRNQQRVRKLPSCELSELASR
jgi:hypothetical protein